jgi:hypothetical protein
VPFVPVGDANAVVRSIVDNVSSPTWAAVAKSTESLIPDLDGSEDGSAETCANPRSDSAVARTNARMFLNLVESS